MQAIALTDDEIVTRCRSGELLDDIGRRSSDTADPASLLNRCVSLHNTARIDLLSLTKTARFDSLAGSNFFTRQQFFYKAIPRLETPPLPLMVAVRALIDKGGNDLAANRPNEAFRNWCAADLTRAHAIIAAAQAGEPHAVDFVTSALVALGDTALTRSELVPVV